VVQALEPYCAKIAEVLMGEPLSDELKAELGGMLEGEMDRQNDLPDISTGHHGSEEQDAEEKAKQDAEEKAKQDAETQQGDAEDAEDPLSQTRKSNDGNEMEVGTAIEAKYGGEHKYYPGEISKINGDGTYAVLYSDGDREPRVMRELIRLATEPMADGDGFAAGNSDSDSAGDRAGDSLLSLLDDDLGSSAGGSAGGSGVQSFGDSDIDGDGDIDGDIDQLGLSGSVDIAVGIDAGDAVGNDVVRSPPLRDLGLPKFGTLRNTGDGVSAIENISEADNPIDEGALHSREHQAMSPSLQSLVAVANAANAADASVAAGDGGAYKVGTAIEARYGGEEKYYPGKIEKANSDGTYVILYADGDMEPRVAEAMIRVAKEAAVPSAADGEAAEGEPALDPLSQTTQRRLEVGTAIEARYGGEEKYYPGKIEKANSDGTYVILYADGDREPSVARGLIRKADLVVASGGKLDVGVAIEARYGGDAKYYPGKIEKDNGDGTYAIVYADGDREPGVARGLIRAVQAAAEETGELEVGAVVKARYGGGQKYYPGKIAKANSDGSYEILYADGDTEKSVAREWIRGDGEGGGAGDGGDDGDGDDYGDDGFDDSGVNASNVSHVNISASGDLEIDDEEDLEGSIEFDDGDGFSMDGSGDEDF
jgi:hypothetical protein